MPHLSSIGDDGGFLIPLACDVRCDKGRFEWNWDLPDPSGRSRQGALNFHVAEQIAGSQMPTAQAGIKFNSFGTIAARAGWSLLDPSVQT